MPVTIQVLNPRTSPNQRAFRIHVWGGAESIPGVQGAWVVYGSSLPAAVARTLRHFRRTAAKGRRFTDWTVNVEPLRAGEIVENGA